jgi:hypothetical protein
MRNIENGKKIIAGLRTLHEEVLKGKRDERSARSGFSPYRTIMMPDYMSSLTIGDNLIRDTGDIAYGILAALQNMEIEVRSEIRKKLIDEVRSFIEKGEKEVPKGMVSLEGWRRFIEQQRSDIYGYEFINGMENRDWISRCTWFQKDPNGEIMDTYGVKLGDHFGEE